MELDIVEYKLNVYISLSDFKIKCLHIFVRFKIFKLMSIFCVVTNFHDKYQTYLFLPIEDIQSGI
jgi:hypothetical protein